MNKTILIAVVTLVLGIGAGYALGANKPVNNQSNTAMHQMPDGSMMGNGGMHEMMADMNAALRGKKDAEFDKAFIDEMIVHHQGAIDMAKLVPQSTRRPELIKLSNDIITAQTGEIEMMNQWRIEWFAR